MKVVCFSNANCYYCTKLTEAIRKNWMWFCPFYTYYKHNFWQPTSLNHFNNLILGSVLEQLMQLVHNSGLGNHAVSINPAEAILFSKSSVLKFCICNLHLTLIKFCLGDFVVHFQYRVQLSKITTNWYCFTFICLTSLVSALGAGKLNWTYQRVRKP
jgi:hypothetical protein